MLRRITTAARSTLSRYFLRTAEYRGSDGAVWFVGSQQRAPSVSAFFAGDDVHLTSEGRIRHEQLADRLAQVTERGELAIVQLPKHDPRLDPLTARAIRVPTLVDLHATLPADPDELGDRLRTSTTREDLRRIRKAGFGYRVSTDPDVLREFYARFYRPLVHSRFPDDGTVASLENMLRKLDRGGELICADLDGEWVAGIYNVNELSHYALGSLGILDADTAIRQTRVTSALIVQSLLRAVELGQETASIGRALPFLGKGPIWFKVKWGGIVTLGRAPSYMYMFLDLRNPAVRRLLADHPIVHVDGSRLNACVWLEAGEDPLRVLTREVTRYPGVERWQVVGHAETLAAASAELSAHDHVETVVVPSNARHPVWLGEALR